MTDNQIEILFKSIENFDAFCQKINQRQDLKLKNEIEIKFNPASPDHVELYLGNGMLALDNLTFGKIVNDLLAEKISQSKQDLLRTGRIDSERLKNEIFELGENKYKVHIEYLEYMLFTSDVASLHDAYLVRLRDLVRIFHRNNVLIIDQTEISNKGELIHFLRSYGFKSVDKDLKLK